MKLLLVIVLVCVPLVALSDWGRDEARIARAEARHFSLRARAEAREARREAYREAARARAEAANARRAARQAYRDAYRDWRNW